VFQILPDDAARSTVWTPTKRQNEPADIAILAPDLDQPVRVARPACAQVTFLVPRLNVQKLFDDPAILHSHVLPSGNRDVQLVRQRIAALRGTIRTLAPLEMQRHLNSLLTLIIATYGKSLCLHGSRRAVNRAVTFEKVRRFVRDNLDERNLTAEYVIESLGVSRPTIYPLFQHEGGLANYIQQLRLRTAAKDLVRFPQSRSKISLIRSDSTARRLSRGHSGTHSITPRESCAPIREPDPHFGHSRSTPLASTCVTHCR
jgi:AraC-like DNA-binding protein